MKRKRIIVVGAGPAGLMAAGKAAGRGHDVMLIEKNDRIGKKLFISGKGRCNITNNMDIQGLIDNIPGNGNFLYSAFHKFSNRDIVSFFEENGLKLKVERGGRIFPESDCAGDVVETLRRFVDRNGVMTCMKSAVKQIRTCDDRVKGVLLKDGREFECDSAVLATGGASYPGTGSTGDGYRIAGELGHRIVDIRPSLVPLMVREDWVRELQGLTLKNISVTLTAMDGKKVYTDFGEMLFTHFGVSGPVILSSSRHALEYGYRDLMLVVDLKPALDEKTLDDRIKRDFKKYSRRQFGNSLDDLLPGKIIPVIVRLSGIVPEKPVNQITKEERQKLTGILKNLTFSICGSRPVEEAIVTAGGISTSEIKPSTMESRLVEGLFFAGEIIDVDGYTGGFNLTIAFSTGYLAGMSC